MNENMYQSADELLHAYIDGELSSDLEQQFFSLLATDSDYRLRLRQLRLIRKRTLTFASQAAPSSALTARVFQQLGISEQRKRNSPVFATKWHSAWAPLASAASAAFITAVILLNLQNSTISPMVEHAEAPARTYDFRTMERVALPSSEFAHMGTDVLHEITADHQTTSTHVLSDAVAERMPSDYAPTNLLSATGDTPLTTSGMPLVADAAPPLTEHASFAADDSPLVVEAAIIKDESLFDTAEQEEFAVDSTPDKETPHFDAGRVAPQSPRPPAERNTGTVTALDSRVYASGFHFGPQTQALSFEVRGVTAKSFPHSTISTKSDPWMENMAVAVYYNGEHSDVGIEYGNEAFSQHYHGLENGRFVRYEQNLLTSWLMGAFRYRVTPVRMLGGIEPYVSAASGITFEAWPLMRFGAGIMYMPDTRVRFHLGFDATILAYPHQNTWFTSKRAGATYGISVLF